MEMPENATNLHKMHGFSGKCTDFHGNAIQYNGLERSQHVNGLERSQLINGLERMLWP